MTLETLTLLTERHGPLLFFALGFGEFIGVPVASVPALIAGGALARMAAGTDPLALVLAASAGGLLADLVLFGLARWKGSVMVDAACGLTSNPNACVLKVTDRVENVGPLFVVGAKFIPGVANLVGPASGLAGVGLLAFLGRDLVALLVWTGAYTTLGWTFAGQIEPVLATVTGWGPWLVPVAVALVGLAALWRLWRVGAHGAMHRAFREGTDGGGEAAA